MKRFLFVLSIVMVMVVSLLVDRASAENWIFYSCRSYSKDGSNCYNYSIVGAYDSLASCKTAEKYQCDQLGSGVYCDKNAGGICDSRGVTDSVGLRQYCWKCLPETINPEPK